MITYTITCPDFKYRVTSSTGPCQGASVSPTSGTSVTGTSDSINLAICPNSQSVVGGANLGSCQQWQQCIYGVYCGSNLYYPWTVTCTNGQWVSSYNASVLPANCGTTQGAFVSGTTTTGSSTVWSSANALAGRATNPSGSK
jgi:hypothetical protein